MESLFEYSLAMLLFYRSIHYHIIYGLLLSMICLILNVARVSNDVVRHYAFVIGTDESALFQLKTLN